MNQLINVNFKKLSDKAVIPAKAHIRDVGFDMVAVSREETDMYISYKTDIAIDLPEGYCALLFPRSSVSKYDLSLCNSIGLVDQNFKGNIEFRYRKTFNPDKVNIRKMYRIIPYLHRLFGFKDPIDDVSLEYNFTTYNIGDKIGQIVIMPYPQVTFTEVNTLTESDRGEDGFGSTDTPAKKPQRSKKKVSK